MEQARDSLCREGVLAAGPDKISRLASCPIDAALRGAPGPD